MGIYSWVKKQINDEIGMIQVDFANGENSYIKIDRQFITNDFCHLKFPHSSLLCNFSGQRDSERRKKKKTERETRNQFHSTIATN